MLKLSSNLVSALVATGSLRSLIGAAALGGKLRLFTGPEPATAAEAIGGGNSLAFTLTESDDGTTELTFEPTSTNGVLTKETTETWSGTNETGSSKTITFYRWTVGSDDGTGAAGGSDYRIQGTVGTDSSFDLWLTNNVFADNEPLTLEGFEFRMPLAAIGG